METVIRRLTRTLVASAFIFVLALTTTAWTADQQDSAKLAFEKMRSLAGEWNGSFQWTGARTDSGKMNVKYYLTGNGSALVEDLSSEGAPKT